MDARVVSVVLMLCCLLAESVFVVNIHTCPLNGGDTLVCPWVGEVDIVRNDRVLTDVTTVVFARIMNPTKVVLDERCPSLRAVLIEDGGVKCSNIQVGEGVAVFVKNENCASSSVRPVIHFLSLPPPSNQTHTHTQVWSLKMASHAIM